MIVFTYVRRDFIAKWRDSSSDLESLPMQGMNLDDDHEVNDWGDMIDDDLEAVRRRMLQLARDRHSRDPSKSVDEYYDALKARSMAKLDGRNPSIIVTEASAVTSSTGPSSNADLPSISNLSEVASSDYITTAAGPSNAIDVNTGNPANIAGLSNTTDVDTGNTASVATPSDITGINTDITASMANASNTTNVHVGYMIAMDPPVRPGTLTRVDSTMVEIGSQASDITIPSPTSTHKHTRSDDHDLKKAFEEAVEGHERRLDELREYTDSRLDLLSRELQLLSHGLAALRLRTSVTALSDSSVETAVYSPE